jgi:lipopolysaccharide export LptBFGC system permease protein LptF
MRVLDRSCLREAGINFLFYGASYLGLIAVVICAPLLKQGAPLGAVLGFLPDNLLFISMLALPLAMVTAQLTTIGRMREDGEITALMAAGVSTTKIVMSLLPLSLLLATWLGFSAHVLLPHVAKRLMEGRAEVLRQATATQVSRRAPI